MFRAGFLFLAFAIFAAPPAGAASYGCGVHVVGEFTMEKAIHQLSTYINTSGSHVLNTDSRAAALYCRGQLYDLTGKTELAIADFSDSITWNPHEAGVYSARGDAYADAGDKDKAALDYAEAQKRGGDAPAKRASLCWQRAVRGRPLDRASEDCDAALKAEPDNMAWRDIRGFLYYRMGRYPDAIADLDIVLRDKPRDASALFIRGIAKLRLGDAASGNADIDAAKASDFHVAEAYAVYGVRP
ncbi:MAG TPA: tetratricopeptide repeat protein [Rhizomicrobium sp.]|nr:tetratricopeptide repeat protein [Rhizomicrobium sp.]